VRNRRAGTTGEARTPRTGSIVAEIAANFGQHAAQW
jgi:hypothetical protein